MKQGLLLLLVLAACAAAPEPSERPPPLPQEILDAALGPATGNDGGSRAQFLSMLGREDLMPTSAQRACTALVRDGADIDPVEEIAQRAVDAQTVIINEAHDAPQHRAFIADVAERLREQGFATYAAETLIVSEARPYPLLEDGFYSREPAYGALLRRLAALGYRFVHYEHMAPPGPSLTPAENIAAREAGQAQNLVDRIFAQDTSARVLIHVGYAHLYEEPDRSGNEWMARRLKAATGIDPLTIDQTRYTAPGENFVVCDAAETTANGVDIRIGAPRVTFESGRPAWRQRAGERPFPVPRELLRADENVIIEARLAGEPDMAVPTDRLLLRPSENLPLLLAAGRYHVEAWTQSTGWSRRIDVEVVDPRQVR